MTSYQTWNIGYALKQVPILKNTINESNGPEKMICTLMMYGRLLRLPHGTASAALTTNEPRREKTNVLVSDLVRHKPGCTATEYD